MNRKTITTTVVSLAKAFCLAGLLSVPAYSSASTVSFEKVNGMYILKAEDSTVKQVFDYIEKISINCDSGILDIHDHIAADCR